MLNLQRNTHHKIDGESDFTMTAHTIEQLQLTIQPSNTATLSVH